MAEVKCGDCGFHVGGDCRILAAATADVDDCSLTPVQRRDSHYQVKRIIGDPGTSKRVEFLGTTVCDGGAHADVTYSVDGGASQVRMIEWPSLKSRIVDKSPIEQVEDALGEILHMADVQNGAEFIEALVGAVIYIG